MQIKTIPRERRNDPRPEEPRPERKVFAVALAQGPEVFIEADTRQETEDQIEFRNSDGELVASYSKNVVQGWRALSWQEVFQLGRN